MDYGLDYQGDMSGGGGGGGGYGGGSAATPLPNRGGHGGGDGQNTGRKRASYDEQTIRAVTIKMMLEAQSQQVLETNNLQLSDGRILHHVSFIAAVRTFDDHSTHVMYQMEDGSGGIMNVKQWLDDSQECDFVIKNRRTCSREHIYLKVVGQLKDYDGQKLVLADSIRPLKTANQITHHFLQVVYQAEMYKKEQQGSFGGTMNMSANRPSMGGFAGTPAASRGKPLQQANPGGAKGAFRQELLKAFGHQGGGNTISNVVKKFQGRYSESEIRNEVDFLCNEGTLYSTIDEDHFAAA